MREDKTTYICYGKDGLLGYLRVKRASELPNKLRAYNKIHKKDLIIRYKNPLTQKEYAVL